MSWLRQWFVTSRRPGRESEVDRELAFHIDALTREYESQGLPAQEARRRAQIEFGGREQVKQQVREVWLSVAWDRTRNNTAAAVRLLRRSLGLSAAVILTLALGIGANTAVFSAVDAILLRPLPYPAGDQLVTIRQFDTRDKGTSFTAPSRLEDWHALNHSFQAISGYYTEDESETSGSLPERLENALIAPRFLTVFGVSPEVGRDLTPAEEHFGGPAAVLISDRLWRRRFGADGRAVRGGVLRLSGHSYPVVGVLPPSFRIPDGDVDIWMPSPPDGPYSHDRSSTWFTVVGRLRPGVSIQQAHADMSTVQRQLGLQFPQTDARLQIRLEPLKRVVVGDAGESLWLLYGAVTLLLLIACINIAALLLARTMDREREIALRFSLGASRAAVVAQLLSEVLLLALLGAGLGLALAEGAILLLHTLEKTLPRAGEISLDGRMLLYTLVVAVGATLVCGLYPALRSTRRELARTLALGGHQQVSTRGTLQWFLVGTQVAFAVVLLVGAGLLLRSFVALGRVNAGFEPKHVLTFQVSAGWGETVDMKRLTQRIESTLDALRAMPGVQAAATSSGLPGVASPGQQQSELVRVQGERDPQHRLLANMRYVSGDYFETLAIPMLLGSDCPRTVPTGRMSSDAIVNQSFARLYLPASGALGTQLSTASGTDFVSRATIRGVVADSREDGVNTAPAPTFYWCVSAPTPSPYFLLRTAGEPMAMAEAVRRKLRQIEPARSVFGISPLTAHMDDNFAEDRLRTGVLSFFAATAIGLASLGLYGTLSYLGRMRQREMGLRLAMGASRAQVAAALMSRGVQTVVVGLFAGTTLALFATRILGGMLYGVTGTEPITYGGIALLVFAIAAATSAGPALRIARIDPARALRDE